MLGHHEKGLAEIWLGWGVWSRKAAWTYIRRY